MRTVWLKELPSDGSLVYPILGPRKGFNFVFHDTWWVAITGRKQKEGISKKYHLLLFQSACLLRRKDYGLYVRCALTTLQKLYGVFRIWGDYQRYLRGD